MDNGEIIEEGNHEYLMAKKGAYYRLYQTLYEAQKEILEAVDARRELEKVDVTQRNGGE